MAIGNRPNIFSGQPFSSRFSRVDRAAPVFTREQGFNFPGLKVPQGVRIRSMLAFAGDNIPKNEAFVPEPINKTLDDNLRKWIDGLDEKTLRQVGIQTTTGAGVSPQEILDMDKEELKKRLFKNIVFTAPAEGL